MESVLYGRSVVRGSYFLVNPDSQVTRDWFYGPMHRSVQRDFPGWPRDSTRFAIQGDNLVLEYYSYPADAPVLTEQTCTRLR